MAENILVIVLIVAFAIFSIVGTQISRHQAKLDVEEARKRRESTVQHRRKTRR